jgi:hypothetical protein
MSGSRQQGKVEHAMPFSWCAAAPYYTLIRQPQAKQLRSGKPFSENMYFINKPPHHTNAAAGPAAPAVSPMPAQTDCVPSPITSWRVARVSHPYRTGSCAAWPAWQPGPHASSRHQPGASLALLWCSAGGLAQWVQRLARHLAMLTVAAGIRACPA